MAEYSEEDDEQQSSGAQDEGQEEKSSDEQQEDLAALESQFDASRFSYESPKKTSQSGDVTFTPNRSRPQEAWGPSSTMAHASRYTGGERSFRDEEEEEEEPYPGSAGNRQSSPKKFQSPAFQFEDSDEELQELRSSRAAAQQDEDVTVSLASRFGLVSEDTEEPVPTPIPRPTAEELSSSFEETQPVPTSVEKTLAELPPRPDTAVPRARNSPEGRPRAGTSPSEPRTSSPLKPKSLDRPGFSGLHVDVPPGKAAQNDASSDASPVDPEVGAASGITGDTASAVRSVTAAISGTDPDANTLSSPVGDALQAAKFRRDGHMAGKSRKLKPLSAHPSSATPVVALLMSRSSVSKP